MVILDNFNDIGLDFLKYLPEKYEDTIYHYTSVSNWKDILLKEIKKR